MQLTDGLSWLRVMQDTGAGHQFALSAPPVAIAGTTLLGIPVSTLVLWGTLVYLVFQIIVIAPKVLTSIRQFREHKQGDRNADSQCSPDGTVRRGNRHGRGSDQRSN